MNLRILGGLAKGRTLQVPESARPSGVRVRKSLFDLLASRAPAEEFPDFLDLHGGSGAIGLEAASRGYRVTLFERDARAARTLEANARALALPVTVRRGDALGLLPGVPSFDLIFSDPPYDANLPALTAALLARPALRPGGLLICQHPKQVDLPPAPAGYEAEERRYGSNRLTLYALKTEPGRGNALS